MKVYFPAVGEKSNSHLYFVDINQPQMFERKIQEELIFIINLT